MAHLIQWRLLVSDAHAATARAAHVHIDHTSHPLQPVVCDGVVRCKAQIRSVDERQVYCNIQRVDRGLDLAHTGRFGLRAINNWHQFDPLLSAVASPR